MAKSKKPAAARKSAVTANKTAVAAKTARGKPAAKSVPPQRRAVAKAPAPNALRKSAPAKAAPAKAAQVKAAPAKAAPVRAAPAKAAAAKVAAVKAPAPAAPAPIKAAPIRRKAGDFTVGDHVVYPTHGVGRIRSIEEQEFAGLKLTLFVIEFEKEKMTLRVPISKANATGMRKLSSPDKMKSALQTLKGRARVKRTMWSRRAQEYEAKINSGDPVSIAEVVRDLHRASGQPEQSYSERQIYENALDRLARELGAVEGLDEGQANERLDKVLKAA